MEEYMLGSVSKGCGFKTLPCYTAMFGSFICKFHSFTVSFIQKSGDCNITWHLTSMIDAVMLVYRYVFATYNASL